MTEPIPTSAIDAAAAALSRHLGTPVELVPTSGPRRGVGPVVRCEVVSAPSPGTVVVKHLPGPPGESRLALLNEWAALQFLSQLELDPPVSPRFYGGDLSEGVLVLEDLGDGDALADLLLGSDSERAEAALASFARTLGRTQAASFERVGDLRDMRAALGPPGGEAAVRAGALAIRFDRALRSIRLSPGDAREDVEGAIACVTRPGPFLTFVHGDACPGNERLVDDRVVLLDFATAGLRHALLDGVCGRLPFPSCWCTRRLPEGVQRLMEEGYRAELVQGCPAARDDAVFEAHAMAATAYWVIETTTMALSSAPFQDFEWGTSSIGQRLAHRARLLVELSEESGSHRALAALLTRVVDQLGLAGERLPLYPAFGGPPVPGA